MVFNVFNLFLVLDKTCQTYKWYLIISNILVLLVLVLLLYFLILILVEILVILLCF